MNRLFSWLDRVSTPRRVLVLLVLEVLLLGCENLLDFPLSVPFMRRAAGHPYLDMCAFCSATEVQAQLDDFGETGRRLQLLLMPTIDVAIPALSCAFGAAALTVLLRGRPGAWARRMRLLPFAALALDLSENAAIVALVTAYPQKLTAVAALMGLLSGLKFAAYLATVTAIGAALARRVSKDLQT
jgi:hypothetical protein